MDNDFFYQLNQSCKSKEKIEEERLYQRNQIDEDNQIKLQQAKCEAEAEYDRLLNSSIDKFKESCIRAVSNGNYIEIDNKKYLKGIFELIEHEKFFHESENTFSLTLSFKFYEPVKKNRLFLGDKIIWDKVELFGTVTLYSGLLSVTSYHISAYNKFLREKCDLILEDENFYSQLKKKIPSIKIDKKCKLESEHWRHSQIREFSFTF